MNDLIAQSEAAMASSDQQMGSTGLHGRLLISARVVCVAAGILSLTAFITSIPVTYDLVLFTLCATPACKHPGPGVVQFVQELQALGFSVEAYSFYNIALNIIFVCGFFAVAIILFWRKSDDWMALFASFFLVTFGIAFAANTSTLPPQPWHALYQCVLFLGHGSVIAFFYLFPNGRFVPRWTRWLTIGAILYWGILDFSPNVTFSQLVSTSAFLGFVGTMIPVQVYRYVRRSNRVQRQQTKWVVFGMAIAVGGYTVLRLFQAFVFASSSPSALAYILLNAVTHLLLLIIPISIAFAILRSRLWDIDIIINRTLVYSLLTAIVVGLYVLVVGGLSTLLQARGNLIISLLATGMIAVLFQPLRSRLQRAINRVTYGERDDPYHIISRLGTQLEATLTPDAILPAVAETVAKTLKLPYVAIELREEGEFRQMASFGTPVEPSLCLPLRYQQESIGQLLLASRSPGEPFSSADRRLLDDLARQAGIAANAVRLSQDLQHSRERLLLAREEERRRLARELHDSVSQALYGISLGAHAARTALSRDPDHVAEPLDYILTLVEAALAEMRALIFELRPESLATEGLVSALSKQAAALQARQELTVATEMCDEPELPLGTKQELYRIAQEAMHNTMKHAHASHVMLRLAQTAEGVTMEVQDNGVGFDPSASFPGHLGLHSMRERITSLGGTFQIESVPGQGTALRVCAPAEVTAFGK
jgi:signal transduction histidine kinase